MKKLLFILLSISMLQSFSQEKGKSGSIIDSRPGRLVRKINSLRNLAGRETSFHPASRTINGLLFSKTFKENPGDHGSGNRKDPVVQKKQGVLQANADPSLRGSSIVGINTEGTPFTNVLPADPVLAAGPGHLLQMVNGSRGAQLTVMDKSGIAIMPPVYMYQLFGQANYFGYGDPVAIYDPFSMRFIIGEFGSDSCPTCYPNALFVGISQSGDPTKGWNFYKFSSKEYLVDFPKLAAWPGVIYATTNDFNTQGSAYLGTSIYAFDKQAMLDGNATVSIQRTRIKAPGYNKYLSLAPVSISGGKLEDPLSPGLFVYFHDDNRTEDPADSDSIGLFSYRVNFSNPSYSSLQLVQQLKVAPFKSRVCNGNRNCVLSAGGEGYDEISDRIMHKVYYREFDSSSAIVFNHTVDAAYPWGQPQAGIRWYELREHGGQWSVFQQSTFAPSNDGRFMGAININQKGQVVLAYNASGPGRFASLLFSGRNAGDPANEMSYPETLLVEGDGYGTIDYRWGDYSDLVVDPSDDSTFWFCGMYGSSNWKTRVAAIKLQGPGSSRLAASIEKIVIPGITCGTGFSPAYVLVNRSTDTLFNINLRVYLDDHPLDTITYTGSFFPGQQINISPLRNYPALPGQHDFKAFLYLEGPPGQDALLVDSFPATFRSFSIVNVLNNNYAESFEEKDPKAAAYSIRHYDIDSWKRTTLASSEGKASLVMQNQVSTSVEKYSSLLLPPLQFSGKPDSVYISMDIAYPGSLEGATNDTLEILLSEPCSTQYKVLYKNWGNGLKTTPGNPPLFIPGDTIGFIPANHEWKNLRVNISDSIGINKPFQLIIRMGSNKGHNLYLDKINVYGLILPAKLREKGYLVYPNPARDRLIIRHWNAPVDLRKIEIFNQAGQILQTNSYGGNASSELQLDMKSFPPGIYQVKLTYTSKVITERIIKTK